MKALSYSYSKYDFTFRIEQRKCNGVVVPVEYEFSDLLWSYSTSKHFLFLQSNLSNGMMTILNRSWGGASRIAYELCKTATNHNIQNLIVSKEKSSRYVFVFHSFLFSAHLSTQYFPFPSLNFRFISKCVDVLLCVCCVVCCVLCCMLCAVSGSQWLINSLRFAIVISL
jgi:hypothetical protein